jgi:hypothetical protein
MNNRSFELMVEAIAQYGPGFVCPSQEELRGPLFEKQMNWVAELRKKHERAWELHGCTLMVDSWTDNERNLHLLSFMVGSVEGIFFLGSADASYLSDYEDLADLIEDRIEAIGRKRVVQVVSDNSHKLKAACRLLMERNPSLSWTPCAFQCLDLILKDIGRLDEFKKHIQQAKCVTTFVYRHHRFLCAVYNAFIIHVVLLLHINYTMKINDYGTYLFLIFKKEFGWPTATQGHDSSQYENDN